MPRLTALLLALCLQFVACGGESGSKTPLAPTPQIPNVVGNYTGTTVITLPELNQTLTCTTTTSVTQSQTNVNIAPLVFTGACAGFSIPIGQATIDNTGALLGVGSFSFTDPSCGSYTGTGSGGFFGRDLRISLNATSRTCWNLNMTITLTR